MQTVHSARCIMHATPPSRPAHLSTSITSGDLRFLSNALSACELGAHRFPQLGVFFQQGVEILLRNRKLVNICGAERVPRGNDGCGRSGPRRPPSSSPRTETATHECTRPHTQGYKRIFEGFEDFVLVEVGLKLLLRCGRHGFLLPLFD